MQPYAPVVNAPNYAPQAAPPQRHIQFVFTGKASEYFRIWIVNTLLTIVTLGIYSAWAKVRNKQYFYRNTLVDGSSFEYLANPIAILKGRIIAAIALGAFFASQQYSLVLYGILALLFILVTPWVWVKALAFNARNSAYRNIRFAFTGRFGEAAATYFGMLLLTVVTCGFAYPYAEWRMTSFITYRHLYGDQTFKWHSKVSDYFITYLIAFALIIPMYILMIIVFAGMAASGMQKDDMQPAIVATTVVLYAYLLIPTAILRARLSNLLYGGIQIGEHTLISRQSGFEMLKLYVTNLIAIAVSFGLLIPWAKVRLAAYRASTLTLVATGSLHAEKLLEDEPGALGQGLSDLGDFDIGIGT
jgi:uncharacterized membrane protein YjgN (DUF898 family)